jgi:short-subunit dehydrogenase
MLQATDRAVVITGASSGVGLTTAYAFACRGARVVLCARGEEPLAQAVRECRALGGHAIGVPTDTRDPEAVRRLARMAAETFDGIGVWVNNAGVGAVGAFWEVPLEAHRATIETDLMGYLHGAHAALPYFLSQGQGALINNISIGGLMPTPYAAAYAASKYAVRGFSDSLRQELHGWPDVHVCTVYPYFLDTPGVQHSANYTGRAMKPAPPVYRPEVVAETIVRLAHEPQREVVVGLMAKLARFEYALAPRLVEAAVARTTEFYLDHAAEAPVTDGNLLESVPGPMAVHGGWRKPAKRAAAVAALGVVAAGVLAASLPRDRALPARR